MKHYAGIDVSLEQSSVCVVDGDGRVFREAKVLSEPDALISWFSELGLQLERIGLEAGPLSQWLHAAMKNAGLAVELIETRHVRTAFKMMPVKTDRKDARGIAQLMRLAYVLLCALRRIGLAHTEFANATCATLRLKLLKIGAQVTISVRRIKIAMASAHPWRQEWALAHARLARL